MDVHVKEFFSQYGEGTGRFHEVIPLHDQPALAWSDVLKKMDDFPRGWFELSRLGTQDRIDFTMEFWMSKLPFHPRMAESLSLFFKSLDDIGVFITQQTFDDPFEATMVYSLKDNAGFYRGAVPATYEDCTSMQGLFADLIFPQDYCAFLQIHNGFRKATDSTGIIPSWEMAEVRERFQAMLSERDNVTTRKGKVVDPRTLIPFYESFGMPFYQCFWDNWHQEQGMGNVYYSGADNKISDPEEDTGSDNMAFPSFSDWLIFYLERIA